MHDEKYEKKLGGEGKQEGKGENKRRARGRIAEVDSGSVLERMCCAKGSGDMRAPLVGRWSHWFTTPVLGVSGVVLRDL